MHLMFLEFLRNLCDPPQFSWDSGCLAWLYREVCRASHKYHSQIGGALQLVQYWAWARLPFLCPKIEPPPTSELFCVDGYTFENKIFLFAIINCYQTLTLDVVLFGCSFIHSDMGIILITM